MAIIAQEKMPSVAIGPMSVCKFGVKRKGTGSELLKTGLFPLIAGMSSDPQMLPVLRATESL